jgi:hypothetical protein
MRPAWQELHNATAETAWQTADNCATVVGQGKWKVGRTQSAFGLALRLHENRL